MHVNRLLESPAKAAEFQILCLPGGFSYGDDIAAGRILGNQIEHHLADTLREFRDAGKLIIGICNGFQILLKTELLLAKDAAGPQATLAANASRQVRGPLGATGSDARRTTAAASASSSAASSRWNCPWPTAKAASCRATRKCWSRCASNGQLVLKYHR